MFCTGAPLLASPGTENGSATAITDVGGSEPLSRCEATGSISATQTRFAATATERRRGPAVRNRSPTAIDATTATRIPATPACALPKRGTAGKRVDHPLLVSAARAATTTYARPTHHTDARSVATRPAAPMLG